MELSAIVNENNLPLTRSERNLVVQLDAGRSELSRDRYDQRMKTLTAARDVLKQLPDRQTTERQNRREKVGMLKERLKMLRQMMPFITPSAAKSLMAEMKQIAAQLASLSAESGAGTGIGMAATGATAAATPLSGNEVENSTDKAQPSETDQGDDGTQQVQYVPSDGALRDHGLKSGNNNAEDRQLKESVEEIKGLYKTVLAALKRKLQADRGSRPLPVSAPQFRGYAVMLDITSRVTVKV